MINRLAVSSRTGNQTNNAQATIQAFGPVKMVRFTIMTMLTYIRSLQATLMLLGGLGVMNSVSFLKRTIDNRSILKVIYNKTVNSEDRDIVGLQGGLWFRNITGFHGTRVNFTSHTTVSKVRPSLPLFSGKLTVSQ